MNNANKDIVPIVDQLATIKGSFHRKEATRRLNALRYKLLWQSMTLIVVLVIWQSVSGRLINPFFISKPSAIGLKLWGLLRDGEFTDHVGYTLFNTMAGYIIGSLLGISFAAAVAFSNLLKEVLDPFVTALYAVPVIAYAPLLVDWLGIGILPKILLAALFVFFIVFINTLAGMQDTNQALSNQLMLFGATRLQILRHVTLPSSLPFMISALRITLPQAMIGAVIGEFISSNRGIGWFINQSASNYDTAGVMAGVLVLAGVVISMNFILNAFQRRYVRRGREREISLGSTAN